MDLEQVLYLNTVKNMVSSFNIFLVETEKMEIPIADTSLVDNLRETKQILHRILNKWDEKSSTQSNYSNPNNELINKRTSSTEDEIHSEDSVSKKNTFSKRRTEMFHTQNTSFVDTKKVDKNKKIKETIRTRDISLDDCERVMMKVRKYIKSDVDDDLEDNTELKKGNSENELIIKNDSLCHQVSNKDIKISSKEVNIENSSHKSEYTDEFILKIANDTFRCSLCEILLPANNISSHVNGKSHRSKKSNISSTSIFANEDFNTSQHIKKGTFYHCDVCDVNMNSEGNVRQHISGAKHKQKCDLLDNSP